MCPPAQLPPYEIGLFWSDEQIITLLANHIPGSDLPDNVLEHSSPFLYPPSNLPEGMWYLVHSTEEKDSIHGFWKAKGEACKVYSDNVVNGWRTTLEYFEGLAPDAQITDWLMQEYKITPKDVNGKYKQTDSQLLCRVFLSTDNSFKSQMKPENCKIIVESKNTNPLKSINPDTNITSDQDEECESQANRQSGVETVPLASDGKPNSPPEDFSEQECFARGDFLELDDLKDPGSHSSSSRNSSCTSKLSEDYFGEADFMRDLEEEVENSLKQEQVSSSGYRFGTSITQNEVVLQPPLSGYVVEASSSSRDTSTDKRVEGHSSKRHNPESNTEGTSNTETSPKNAAAPNKDKKAGSSRMKKLRTYFCFATF